MPMTMAAYMPERRSEDLVAESLRGVVSMGGERRESCGHATMGVHGSSGLDGGVSASEEDAEEDDESSVVVSIGEVIGTSMAVLSTWRRGDGRYTGLATLMPSQMTSLLASSRFHCECFGGWYPGALMMESPSKPSLMTTLWA